MRQFPITGSIVSGTYNDKNIKNYAHGMFQSVYDYPVLSSSANHIFDISYGYSPDLSSSANLMNAKKINIYNQMAQQLVGYDETSTIRKFDKDGDFSGTPTNIIDQCLFLSYSRLLYKDEIKKGSYTLTLNRNGLGPSITLGDYEGVSNYRTNSPAGEYGMLYTASSGIGANSAVGLIYYQAGVVVLNAISSSTPGVPHINFQQRSHYTGSYTISGAADDFRSDWQDNDFLNTTELNSTIYFCRAANNEI